MKKAIYFFITFLLTILILLLAAEFMIRKSGKYPTSGIQYDSELIWRLKRNHLQIKSEGDTVTFNKNGFRGRNFHMNKSKDLRRIMVIGDSYTFGGIEYGDNLIFTSLLEMKLNKNSGAGEKYEVMNISAPSWSTDQQYIYLLKEGIRYNPDYVILMVAPNDLREAYRKRLVEIDKHDSLIINKVQMPLADRIGWYLSNHYSLFQYFQTKHLNRNYGTFFEIFNHYPVNFGVEDEGDWDRPLFLNKKIDEVEQAKQLFEHILCEINNICKSNNTKLILSIIPTKTEFVNKDKEDFSAGMIASFIDELSDKHDIVYCNLFTSAMNLTDPLSIYMSWEYHFNEIGHEFTADNLYECFSQFK